MTADLSILVKTTQVSGGRRVLFDIAAEAAASGLATEIRSMDGATAPPDWWPSPPGIAWRGFTRESAGLGRVCITSRLSIAAALRTHEIARDDRLVLLAQGIPLSPLSAAFAHPVAAWRDWREFRRALGAAGPVWAIAGAPHAWWTRRAPGVVELPAPHIDAAFGGPPVPAPAATPLRVVSIGNGKSGIKNVSVLYRAMDACGVPLEIARVTPTAPTPDELRIAAARPGHARLAFHTAVPAAEVARLIDGAHLVASASTAQEGFALPPREAIARGRSVLVSAIAAHRTGLEDLPVACVYGAPGDWRGLARALAAFAANPAPFAVPAAIRQRVLASIASRHLERRAVELIRERLAR